MYLNKDTANKLCILLICIGIQSVICVAEELKPAPGKNDYVLRSCMSSVQFIRRNIGATLATSKLAPQTPRGRTLSSLPGGGSIPDGPPTTLRLSASRRDRRPLLARKDHLPKVPGSNIDGDANEVAIVEEQERFHRDIKIMEDMYQERSDTHMIADWRLEFDARLPRLVSRKTRKDVFLK